MKTADLTWNVENVSDTAMRTWMKTLSCMSSIQNTSQYTRTCEMLWNYTTHIRRTFDRTLCKHDKNSKHLNDVTITNCENKIKWSRLPVTKTNFNQSF